MIKTVNPGKKNGTLKMYAVLPFEYIPAKKENGMRPEIAEAVRERVTAALTLSGVAVMGHQKIAGALMELGLSWNVVTSWRAAEIGRLLGAGAVVFGTVSVICGADPVNDNTPMQKENALITPLEYTVTAVHTETESILWVLSNEKDAPSCCGKPDHTACGIESINDAVRELMSVVSSD